MTPRASPGGARGVEQDLAFGGKFGITDIHLQQEAVELGFGQRIGALLFQRVLRCENVERLRQLIGLAGHGDVVFLHGLQQRGLRARAGAVDFIGHQQLRKTGPLMKRNERRPFSSWSMTSEPRISDGIRSGVN